jgi:periplasmic glucans biosynthesis protein
MPKRRSVLAGASAWLTLSWLGLPQGAAAASAALKLGAPRPFSFDGLVRQAQAGAAQPYVAPDSLPQDVLDRIDYEAHGKIQFNTDYALFRDGPGAYPVTFFHLGRYFRTPVRMHVLDSRTPQTQAREIIYDPQYFIMPPDSPAHGLPRGAGFAGFRFQESRLGDQSRLPWQHNDWVAFLGASYFRAIGELYQYGLSARGVAVDVVLPDHPEEFPAFTRFYFEPPAGTGPEVTVYALLEGPSLTGAYRFRMRREKAVLMDIAAHLFLRRDIGRLGIAPMTSMFWFSETVKPTAIDWRPEVHDSDGLAIWTGGGERIWRPLNNPGAISVSAFADSTPRGFGLLQRDRQFDHYLDGVAYQRRPSLWVEPQEGWSEGAVQLIELPTDDEIHDNIVAMWVPKEAAKAGGRFDLSYRLHWTDEEPYPTPLARCVATRLGRGGQPGQPRPRGVIKFMVEFLGGPLTRLPYGVKPQAVLSAGSGTFSYVFTEAVPDGVLGHWRAQFDFTPQGPGVTDMRLFLKNGGETLSETWLYQLHTPLTGS